MVGWDDNSVEPAAVAAAYMDGKQPHVNFMELLMGGDQVHTAVWGLVVGLTTALHQWNRTALQAWPRSCRVMGNNWPALRIGQVFALGGVFPRGAGACQVHSMWFVTCQRCCGAAYTPHPDVSPLCTRHQEKLEALRSTVQSGKIFNVRLQIVDPTLRSWMNLLPDEEVHYDVQITLSSDPITLQRVFTVSQARRFLGRTSAQAVATAQRYLPSGVAGSRQLGCIKVLDAV